jgi:hypothetical protein
LAQRILENIRRAEKEQKQKSIMRRAALFSREWGRKRGRPTKWG